MRIIKRIFGGLLIVAGLLVAGAYLLPRHVIVTRSIVIDAPPADIFPHINSLQAFSEWSPWSDRDPHMQVGFSGPESGLGNVMEWSSDDRSVGSGRQEIVASVENERVASELNFGSMGTAAAWFALEPSGGRHPGHLGS